MMTYKKLYNRIRETTGLDVLTEGAIQTIIENCYADLTSRGYREYNQKTFIKSTGSLNEETNFEDLSNGLYKIKLPDDYRKALHVKVAVDNKVHLGFRLSLSDERINSIVMGDGTIRSNFAYLDKDVIYYIIEDYMYIEVRCRDKEITNIVLGYDKRLVAPVQPKLTDYDTAIVTLRSEFEDAIVLFGSYFLLQRYTKDTDRVQIALNNYKYFVEDLTYTLAHEDNFTDEDGIVCIDRV